MKRRSFLSSVAGSAFILATPAIVRAQSKRFEGVTLNLNSYGGDYDRLLVENVAKPLEQRTGLKVTYQSGTGISAVAKALASKDDPPFDILLADSPSLPDLIHAGIVDGVAAGEVPNMSKLLPGVREFGDIGVPFLTNAIILTYNSKLLKRPIASYADLSRSDLEGRVSFLSPGNVGGILTLLGLAEANGGSIDNMDPAFAELTKMRRNITAVPDTSVSLLQLFEQEEAWAGAFYDGRIYSMRASGKPMVAVVPKEGIYALYNYMCPIKNSKKRAAILAYIDQALSDEALRPMVEFFRYAPCTDVKISDAVAKDIVPYGENRKAMKPVDWTKVAAARASITERFNKTIR
jgi:putative spermidine/putrescine transport system substrate-binding protein